MSSTSHVQGQDVFLPSSHHGFPLGSRVKREVLNGNDGRLGGLHHVPRPDKTATHATEDVGTNTQANLDDSSDSISLAEKEALRPVVEDELAEAWSVIKGLWLKTGSSGRTEMYSYLEAELHKLQAPESDTHAFRRPHCPKQSQIQSQASGVGLHLRDADAGNDDHGATESELPLVIIMRACAGLDARSLDAPQRIFYAIKGLAWKDGYGNSGTMTEGDAANFVAMFFGDLIKTKSEGKEKNDMAGPRRLKETLDDWDNYQDGNRAQSELPFQIATERSEFELIKDFFGIYGKVFENSTKGKGAYLAKFERDVNKANLVKTYRKIVKAIIPGQAEFDPHMHKHLNDKGYTTANGVVWATVALRYLADTLSGFVDGVNNSPHTDTQKKRWQKFSDQVHRGTFLCDLQDTFGAGIFLIMSSKLRTSGMKRAAPLRQVLLIVKTEFPVLTDWCENLTKLVAEPMMRGEKCRPLHVNLEDDGSLFDARLIELETDSMEIDK